jgi:predicted metal-dependent enzyme (double-stranded beta helix superfamily)
MKSMNNYTLDTFIEDCRKKISECQSPADCVEQITPAMYRLLNGDKSFLKPEHFRSDPDHYARNAIYIEEADTMSLYALVWLPGQWTPIHDHGTWGVVGVLEGNLEERNFMRADDRKKDAMTGVELARGGVILLSPDAVTSFVPNPDHIHITGNPADGQRVVSLHLYGHVMSGFHIYDKEARTRKWVEVSHNES